MAEVEPDEEDEPVAAAEAEPAPGSEQPAEPEAEPEPVTSAPPPPEPEPEPAPPEPAAPERDEPEPADTYSGLSAAVEARLAAQRGTRIDSEGAGIPPPPPPASTPRAEDRLDRLRSQSAAYAGDDHMQQWLAWGMLGGGLLIGLGAALTWGDARISGDFPLARLLALVSAVAAITGFVMGTFLGRRLQGAYVAGGGAVLGLLTLFLYARESGLGMGFIFALLGVAFVAGLVILAVSPYGGGSDDAGGGVR